MRPPAPGVATRVLIKVGGTLLDRAESRDMIACQIAQAVEGGCEAVVVHGGGKQMTRFLGERGIESRFVNGLRVTTPETIDAVLKVFTGSVNHELVAALVAAGAQAVGISGIDALLAEAEQLSPELGAVGRVVRSNAGLLDVLAGHGYLPVVACVAGDRQGRIYNVNADQMAVACAAAFRAGRLIFLTDVAGVLGADRALIPSLTVADCESLIEAGVATGGMLAKLNAASEAIRQGVGRITIAPGGETQVLSRVLSGEPVGSQLVKGAAA